MPIFDPLKSLSIDPLKYLSNSYTPSDPFTGVNKQLRAVGLDPLSFDAPAQQDIGVPSAHTALDDLTPEQLEGAKEKAGGGLLSGLAWAGEKLDALTGARAVRGVLGGNFREILSTGPLGLVSDELGLTKKEDIIYGRELLEKGGILGKNKPGFDWGDVTGFGADVALDPSTWFFGLGLATKGAKAATAAGKQVNKIGKLDDILDLASTTKGAEALGLPKAMGPRQAGMSITLRKAVNAELSGGLDDMLGMPGLRHPAKIVGGGLGQPLRKSSILGELAETGADISKLMDQPLTSSVHVGLPNFLANVGFKDLRPLKWLRSRPMNIKPGGRVEGWAQLMDKLGSSARWSVPGRQLSRLFDPRLRKTESGTRVAVTKVAQQARIKEYRFMERTAQQVHRAGYEFGAKWVDTPHFNAQKMLDDNKAYKGVTTIEDAKDTVRQNWDEMTSRMEGYHLMEDGTMKLPDWNSEVVVSLEKSFKKSLEAQDKVLKALRLEKRTAESALRNAARAPGNLFVNVREVNRLAEPLDRLTAKINNLQQVRNSDFQILADVSRKGVKDQASLGQAVAMTEEARFADEGLTIQGGVSKTLRGRAQLSPHLKDIEGDLDMIAQKYKDAFEYAQRRGVDITSLKDNYALFTPRMLFRVPETTPKGAQSAAAMGRSYANYGTKHQIQRATGLTGWFGGTNFINRLSRQEKYVGAAKAGMTSTDTKTIIDDVAKMIVEKELPEMIVAGGDDAIRAYQALNILDDNAKFVTNAYRNSHVQGLARFLAELDGRIIEKGASAFEMNPALAMMGYYVDVVRAGHATEIATSLVGEHAMFGARFAEKGLVGSRETVDAMLGGWGKADRGAQPVLKIRTLRDLRKLNGDWDEMRAYIGSDSQFSLLGKHIDEIVDGDLDVVLKKFVVLDAAGDVTEKSAKLSRQMSVMLDQLRLPSDLAADATRYVKSFTDPDTVSEFAKGFDRMTDILKSSFTTPWPAFHFRNFLSGQANNYFIGAYDPNHWGPKKWYQPVLDAKVLLRGGTIQGIADKIPMFKGGKNIPTWAKADPDAYVSEWIRRNARSYDIIGPQHTREHLVALGEAGGQYDPMQTRFYADVPGQQRLRQRLKDTWSNDQPWYRRMMGGAREVGYEVEGYNRLAPMVAFLKQGFSLDELAKKVKLAQVDYTMLTDFEKTVMRRLIPFYTFTRRQIPFVLEQLADPSGSVSQTVKGISRIKGQMKDLENPQPDWISSDFAIPLPGGEEGQQRYLTRAGGMLGGMEDVFSLLKPGRTTMGATRRTLSGIGSRMHPLLQAPIELGTGQSLFLQRPLSETKPATARLIGGITGAEQVPSFPGPLTESVISRLPFFGRGVSTLRSLTDPRKPLTVDGELSSLNLAARMMPSIMGVRIAEVNMERIKNRVMQEAIEEHLRHNQSIRTFKHIYVPEAQLENMDEESRALYLLYKQISSQAAKASRARKKEEESRASAYSM